VAIVNAAGAAVLPSVQAVNDGSYNPLARPVFIYVSRAAAERPEIAAFVEFYMRNAGKLVDEVHYVPLGAAAYDKTLELFAGKRVGTVFGGQEEVGVKVEDLLQRDAVE
jgi:phosphate transport system substrate-binding protein